MSTFRLGDDGTMDTVVVCTTCGHEDRYTTDLGTDTDAEQYAADVDIYIETYQATRRQAEEAVDRRYYDEFVAWAIEESETDHECDLDANDNNANK